MCIRDSGYTLDEIKNAITGKTYASFEPMLDYCVVKIPRLPFDKFITAKRTLTTQMKATGEVMSICNNFDGALMKAIRSLEPVSYTHLDTRELERAAYYRHESAVFQDTFTLAYSCLLYTSTHRRWEERSNCSPPAKKDQKVTQQLLLHSYFRHLIRSMQ